MAYKIHYKSSVQKDLKGIPKTDISLILDNIEKELIQSPFLFPKLKGDFKNLRKFRIGKYRVIYTIQNNDIIILKIGHRKDIYRKL